MTFLLFPFIASLLYVAATLFVKRTAELGIDLWRITFVANLVTAALFLCVWPMGGEFPGFALLWQPALVALAFLSGQLLMFVALEKGDISIVTPVLGTKILVVATFQTLLTAERVPPILWVSSAFAVGAVALMQIGVAGTRQRVGFTIVVSFCCGTAFAIFDVLVQEMSPAWGVGRFLPCLFGFVALFSLIFLVFVRAPLPQIQKHIWRGFGPGTLLMGAHALAMVSGIALYGHATEMNIVYAARGLWSVLAVWLIGHWFKNSEQKLGAKVLGSRLVGALLLLVAIGMLLLNTQN
ncbi:MAG: DMT family transporter [Pirellulales bacterium]